MLLCSGEGTGAPVLMAPNDEQHCSVSPNPFLQSSFQASPPAFSPGPLGIQRSCSSLSLRGCFPSCALLHFCIKALQVPFLHSSAVDAFANCEPIQCVPEELWIALLLRNAPSFPPLSGQ